MNKITITIETGNAAFGETPGEATTEIGRILRKYARQIEDDPSYIDRVLADSNGNKVGRVVVE